MILDFECVRSQGYHWWHNAESYFLIGKVMGTGMVKAMQGVVEG